MFIIIVVIIIIILQYAVFDWEQEMGISSLKMSRIGILKLASYTMEDVFKVRFNLDTYVSNILLI